MTSTFSHSWSCATSSRPGMKASLCPTTKALSSYWEEGWALIPTACTPDIITSSYEAQSPWTLMLDCLNEQATVNQQAPSLNLKSVSPAERGEHAFPPYRSPRTRAASGTVQDGSLNNQRLTKELSFGVTYVLLWAEAAFFPTGISPHVSLL